MNNAITLFVTGLLVLMTVVFLVRLVVVIGANLKNGRFYRQALARRMQQLRLSKMLQALGIDLNEYLAGQDVNAIHRQMENCSRCENTRDCDEQLASEAVTAEQIGFCNNEQELVELVTGQAGTASAHTAATSGEKVKS
jgi:hypothetical protein